MQTKSIKTKSTKNVKVEAKKTRNSNIEVLRIISMLLIIAFHFTRSGYANPDSPIAFITTRFLSIWGLLGVDIFLIISAWFLSEQEFRIKKVIHIVFQTFTWYTFFAIIFLLYDCFYCHNGVIITLKDFFNNLIGDFFQSFWGNNYWFITAYFFMLLASPFLNKILNKLSKSQVQKILLVFIFVPIYAQFTTSIVCDVFRFLYVYLLIGYIRKYGSKLIEKYTKKPFYILLMALVILSSFVFAYLPTENYFINILKAFINSTIGCTGRHSMMLLIIAMLIFFRVLKKKPTHNKIINKIASYSLGVYFFHESFVLKGPNVTDTFARKINALGLMNFDILFPLRFILAVLVIFILGIILEAMRDFILQKPFMKFVSNKYGDKLKRIDNWFNTF